MKREKTCGHCQQPFRYRAIWRANFSLWKGEPDWIYRCPSCDQAHTASRWNRTLVRVLTSFVPIFIGIVLVPRMETPWAPLVRGGTLAALLLIGTLLVPFLVRYRPIGDGADTGS